MEHGQVWWIWLAIEPPICIWRASWPATAAICVFAARFMASIVQGRCSPVRLQAYKSPNDKSSGNQNEKCRACNVNNWFRVAKSLQNLLVVLLIHGRCIVRCEWQSENWWKSFIIELYTDTLAKHAETNWPTLPRNFRVLFWWVSVCSHQQRNGHDLCSSRFAPSA